MAEPDPIDEGAARVWTPAGFVTDDPWQSAPTLGELAADAHAVLPLAAFLSLDEAERAACRGRLGVVVDAGEAIEPLVPHLAHLQLVALRFPAYTDGRSYSKATLLRQRHAYQGDLRAVGDVLIDQVAHMLRCGFSSLEITNAVTIRRLHDGRTGGLGLYYQSAVRTEPAAQGYGWRRRSA